MYVMRWYDFTVNFQHKIFLFLPSHYTYKKKNIILSDPR